MSDTSAEDFEVINKERGSSGDASSHEVLDGEGVMDCSKEMDDMDIHGGAPGGEATGDDGEACDDITGPESDDDAPVAEGPEEGEPRGDEEAKEEMKEGGGEGGGDTPRAVQIVSLDGGKCTLNKDAFERVVSQVPPRMKVSVVSVVGAFRTGKSFLLDFMLRYLRATSAPTPKASMPGADEVDEDAFDEEKDCGGKDPKELSKTPLPSWVDADSPLEGRANSDTSAKGFVWKFGLERQTTGIWMWNRPFFRDVKGERTAVLLVDTQGMFDAETSQSLTAAVFGLSTLLSSYQIYNVMMQVAEDNIQHLAVFAEYGRIAHKSILENTQAKESGPGVGAGEEKDEADADDGEAKEESEARDDAAVPKAAPVTPPAPPSKDVAPEDRPFQTLEFLVRDAPQGKKAISRPSIADDYMAKLMSEKPHEDMNEVRTQIRACFKAVSCFMLIDPGDAVRMEDEDEAFDGSITEIRSLFVHMLDRFFRRVFNHRLAQKNIHGRPVTASQLQLYFQAYVDCFNGDDMPDAHVLLHATAMAQNHVATQTCITKYDDMMRAVAGPGQKFLTPEVFALEEEKARKECLAEFDSIARFGSAEAIKEARDAAIKLMDDKRETYSEMNAHRQPFRNLENYILPLSLAVLAWIMRVLSDNICGSLCSSISDFLAFTYGMVFLFLVIMMMSTTHGFMGRLRAYLNTLIALSAAAGKMKQD